MLARAINSISDLTFKEKVHSRYLQLVQDRIDVFRDMISSLIDDAQNDAKGSAGDKHETGLSMMHLEQEKLSAKLREAIDQKVILERLPLISSRIIAPGCLVRSSGFVFYISTALPKIVENGKTVFAVSPVSPIGSSLLGKAVGESISLQGKVYTIEAVE